MSVNLLESYKNRINLAESVYMQSHNGAKMSIQKKTLLASVLDNTSRFINEAWTDTAATQRAALGDYKKFCLNVTNVAVPNLILPELMLVQPMSSISGYITYMKYTAGVTKGGVAQDQLFNGVFRMGTMDEDRANYTSERVVEAMDSIVSGTTKVAWTPVLADSAKALDANGADITALLGSFAVAADGTITATNGSKNVDDIKKIAYVYNNILVPQNSVPNSLPTLKAQMDVVPLTAKARRIAVYYSQIAAFQGKNDYGFDMGQQLAQQAQGELAYEIDSEGVMMLFKGAEKDNTLTFAKYVDDKAISRTQYYEAFIEIINRAKAIIYKRTQKFAPTYMVCGADVLTILPYLKGWTAAPVGVVNGPYFAGTIDGLKVFVSPAIGDNKFFFGVNGADLQSSAGVYAPYMAIVPTQLLGFADGTMSQGFSTMYDMKLLSTYNLVVDGGGNVTGRVDAMDGQYSWLLVSGEMTGETTNLGIAIRGTQEVVVTNTEENPVPTQTITG